MRKVSNYLYKIGASYQTPINLSYWWNLGSLASYALLLQIVSGSFLSFWYIPSTTLASDSVEYIMREVNYGWLIRYFHSNGASFFFLLFIYICRKVYIMVRMYTLGNVFGIVVS